MANLKDVVRVLQITDSHLRAELDGNLLGMVTLDSLDAVMTSVQSTEPDPDLILVTGDIAQDGSIAAYQLMADRLRAFRCPIIWSMGNHDQREAMDAVAGPLGYMRKSIELGDWLVVCLDSSCPRKVYGRIDPEELEWLAETLSNATQSHILVSLHHHPVEIGSRWLDTIGLHNSEAFLDIIDRCDRVRAVLWGHVHQAYDQQRNAIRLLSTPSTCVQFKPGSEDFAVDDEPPGYRTLSLKFDGSIDTLVHRVEDIEFEVDLNSKGY